MVVGLWLNITRVELRKSAGVLMAISSAVGESLPREMFHALAEDESEGDAAYEKYQAERRAAKSRAETMDGMRG